MRLGEARMPDGMRIYAIGDVHGCDGLLAAAHGHIAADRARHPPADWRIVHLGDYVDRGPDSPAVLDRLIAFMARESRVVCLRGNHDELMRGFLVDPVGQGPLWLGNGGAATLAGYGIRARGAYRSDDELAGLGDSLRAVLPASHRAFLEALAWSDRFGDFFFCHAGIRPGVPLDVQTGEDLTWIREEFLDDPRDHGVVVVHGHTPVQRPEVRPNRINIDTGAVFTGNLTTLVLEASAYRFL